MAKTKSITTAKIKSKTTARGVARFISVAIAVSIFSFAGSIVVAVFVLPTAQAPSGNIAAPLNLLPFYQEKLGTLGATRFLGLFPDRYFDPAGESVIEGVLDTSASETNRVVSINASDTHIENVAYPQLPQDAANKQYVDDVLGGL